MHPTRYPLLLVPLLLLTGGCMPDAIPPDGSDGECDNNGKCETAVESCQSCPSDCPCCYAYQAFGNGQVASAENAVGKPDSKYAQLGSNSVLVLAMGQGIQNQAGMDLKLHGTVQASTSLGGVTVSARDSLPHARGQWFQVGIWSPSTPPTTSASFDVGHVPFSGPSFSEIMLESTAGVLAKIDAIEAIHCTK